MLAQSVVNEFSGNAVFVQENYGDSKLARRFGVTRYPAIFVDDILIATPNDFGFYGKGEGEEGGRYAPLKNAASHARFQSDLRRMISLVLEGRADLARSEAAPAEAGGISRLPHFNVTDLDGRRLSAEEVRGRIVLVEFWATWCPPCRSTLDWLGDLRKRHADDLAIVAIAVESDEATVRRLVEEIDAPLTWTMGTAELARSFGDITAVPTLFLFDRDGSIAGTYYGAPPTLHSEVERRLATLLARSTPVAQVESGQEIRRAR